MSNCSKAAWLALGAAAVITARAGAQDSAAAPAPAKPTKLFASDSIFAITIGTDLKKYASTRDSAAPWIPGRLVVGGDTLHVRVRPRGHFRRKSSTCSFQPLEVKFDKGVKGTLFAKQNTLKLVTTCWPGRAEYEAYIPQEYLVYRAYNLITPVSFRARLVRVTYADTVHADRPPIVTMAFFLEDQKDMAARNGGTMIKAKNAGRDDFDPALLALLSLFQFMIANTDWGFASQHNIRFVRTGQFGVVFPVAYDFDFSGVVGTRYATPDPSIPIRSVKNRIWTSYCYTPQDLAPAVAVFNAQRAAITALYTDSRLLDPKAAQGAVAYYEEFYAIINDANKLNKEIQRHCAG